jgi:hypothetical protein
MPLAAELDALHASFQTTLEQWRKENPRNAELFALVEAEIARARSAD